MIRLRAENAKNRHGRSVAVEGTLGAVMERRWAGADGREVRMAADLIDEDSALIGGLTIGGREFRIALGHERRVKP